MLSAESLEHLKSHRYQTTGYTVLDTKVFNPFWEAFVRLMPLWLAPNLMTVIGLTFMFLSYGVMAWFDHSLEKQIPCWALGAAALFQFIYQTLDACDGKQARRTGSSSPLGMLVDHGCDSLSVTIMILTLSQSVGLGHGFHLLVLASGLWGAFYIATWEEYHTHFCRTQICNFGVTENQLFAMFLYLSAGVLTTSFYAQPVTILGSTMPLRVAVLYFMMTLSAITQVWMIASSLRAAQDKTVAVARLLPLVALNGAIYSMSRCTAIFNQYPALCVFLCGLYFSLIVGRLIICSVTKTNFSPLQWEALPFFLFSANSAWFHILPESIAFGILAGVISLSYISFILRIINQLTTALGIRFFSIKSKES